MKAVSYDEYAPDDNYEKILKVKDIDDPKPKPDEVVFSVKAAALNYNDIWGMRGNPVPVPLPHVSGSDAAGDVVAVGEDVVNFKVGDRVVSHANMSCRSCSACTDGREFDCIKRTDLGISDRTKLGCILRADSSSRSKRGKDTTRCKLSRSCSCIHDHHDFMAHACRSCKYQTRSNCFDYGWWIKLWVLLQIWN